MNQTGYGVYHGCLESKTERIFAIACLGKKLVFHTEMCNYFEYLIFKYSIFLSGQGVVQIEPNSVLSIPWVLRV